MITKLFYSIGYAIFGTANAGIATYTLFQMTTMALIFSYLIHTVYRQGAKTAGASGCWPILRWFLSMRCTA